MPITYTKLRDGNWGLRGEGLTEGSRVTVSKRDGSSKQETVGKVFWTDGQVCLAAIARGESFRAATQDAAETECAECGAPLRGRGTVRRDSSGISGCVCGRCVRIPSYELSFA